MTFVILLEKANNSVCCEVAFNLFSQNLTNTSDYLTPQLSVESSTSQLIEGIEAPFLKGRVCRGCVVQGQ